MSGLEGEWRRREATRKAEVAKIKAHYAELDTQTRQVCQRLFAVWLVNAPVAAFRAFLAIHHCC